MVRSKMGIAEAMEALGFKSGDAVNEELIKASFRKLAFATHTDKNKNIDNHSAGLKMAKLTEAKKVLLENISLLPKVVSEVKDTKTSVFVDFIKTVDLKRRKNPFGVYTKYKKGKGK